MTSTEYDMGYKDGYKNCLKANGLDKNTEPVSTETSSGKFWPCEHIFKNEDDVWEFNSSNFLHCIIGKDWKQCPVCLKERPKELSLAEKFAKAMGKRDIQYVNVGSGPVQPLECELEEIAKEHYGEK